MWIEKVLKSILGFYCKDGDTNLLYLRLCKAGNDHDRKSPVFLKHAK